MRGINATTLFASAEAINIRDSGEGTWQEMQRNAVAGWQEGASWMESSNHGRASLVVYFV